MRTQKRTHTHSIINIILVYLNLYTMSFTCTIHIAHPLKVETMMQFSQSVKLVVYNLPAGVSVGLAVAVCQHVIDHPQIFDTSCDFIFSCFKLLVPAIKDSGFKDSGFKDSGFCVFCRCRAFYTQCSISHRHHVQATPVSEPFHSLSIGHQAGAFPAHLCTSLAPITENLKWCQNIPSILLCTVTLSCHSVTDRQAFCCVFKKWLTQKICQDG